MISNVLLISGFPPPEGGISTWSVNYLKYFNKYEKDISIHTVNTSLNCNSFSHKRTILSEFKRFSSIIGNLKKTIRKNSIDVCHFNTACSNRGVFRDYICAKILKRKKIPIVLQCHCNIRDQLTKRIAIKIFKKIVSCCNIVLTLNDDSKEFLQTKFAAKNVDVLPNFIDKSFLVDRHKTSLKIQSVSYVGHIQKTKGCNEIFECAKSFPYITFKMIGTVDSRIDLNNVPNNVLFVGRVNREMVKSILCSSDLFIFPSYSEGFSISLLEAMSCGLPCIATDVGANKDMIEDKGGIIINPRSANELIESIGVLENYQLRKKMSEWNINKVLTNYLDYDIFSKLKALYINTISKID